MRYVITISLIIISFSAGCMLLFHFREPKKEEFQYFAKKMVDPRLHVSGVYCRTKIVVDERSDYLITFGIDGLICYEAWGGRIEDSLSDFVLQSTKNSCASPYMNNKGFYYITHDTLKIEILGGDAGHGYYFYYFDGLLSGDTLTLAETGERRYRKAMPGGSTTSYSRKFQYIYRP